MVASVLKVKRRTRLGAKLQFSLFSLSVKISQIEKRSRPSNSFSTSRSRLPPFFPRVCSHFPFSFFCLFFFLFSFVFSSLFQTGHNTGLESLFVKAQCRLIFESTPRRKPTGGNSILARDHSVKTKLNSGVSGSPEPRQPSRR